MRILSFRFHLAKVREQTRFGISFVTRGQESLSVPVLLLEEESLHASRLHHRHESITSQLELIHQTDVVRVITEIRTPLRQVAQTPQVHGHTLREMRCVDHRDGDRAVGVHEGRDVDVLGIAACVHAHRTRTCEPEVASESPQAGRHVVGIAVETDQSVVAGRVLRTPPLVGELAAVHWGGKHRQLTWVYPEVEERVNALCM